MASVKYTGHSNLYVREDGFVSEHGKDGPWTRGFCLCTNSDRVRRKGTTPKYYYVVHHQFYILYVHRLVALAFCENPNPQAFPVVDHISGDSLANDSSNLRWLNHQLNMMNQCGSKNCYFMKRLKKWRACVTVNGERHAWGYFNSFRQAHLAAQEYKSARFTEIYLSYVTNESETTATCKYLLGRPGPVLHGFTLHNPGICRTCLLRAKKQCVHNQLPEAGTTPETEGATVPVPVKPPPARKEIGLIDKE